MGTNYYWRHNICTCCGRYDEWHICKSLNKFRAYFGEQEWSDDQLRYKPAPVLIASWSDWKERLRKDGEVWDEYGERLDVEQFVASVERVPAESRRRQYDWVTLHRPGPHVDAVEPDGEWLDAEGFSFYGADFS